MRNMCYAQEWPYQRSLSLPSDDPHKLTHTDGETWRDPPGYFDTIVWPAYVLAHSKLEQQGVEQVDVGDGPEGLTRAFEVVCEMIMERVERVERVKGTLS